MYVHSQTAHSARQHAIWERLFACARNIAFMLERAYRHIVLKRARESGAKNGEMILPTLPSGMRQGRFLCEECPFLYARTFPSGTFRKAARHMGRLFACARNIAFILERAYRHIVLKRARESGAKNGEMILPTLPSGMRQGRFLCEGRPFCMHVHSQTAHSARRRAIWDAFLSCLLP